MLLLHELGEARRIPARTAAAMVAGLDALLLHIFPIQPAEQPPASICSATSPVTARSAACTQVLAACGIDVARALPWVKPWFARYQMADGGLNCDDTAYPSDERVPELDGRHGRAVRGDARRHGVERRRARVRRARGALPRRSRARARLADGAQRRGARRARRAGRALAFPRFYFYDVAARRSRALVRWSVATAQPLPLEAPSPA